MPLVRKPTPVEPLPEAKSFDRAAFDPGALVTGTPQQRWDAVRAAAGWPDAVVLLAEALVTETDGRVREAILTGLVRIGTAEAASSIVPLIRSNEAGLRTAAIDALLLMPAGIGVHVPLLLQDADPDVRLLSCELARALPRADANRLLGELLDRETEKNVSAAALEVIAETGGPELLPILARCEERFADDPFIAFALEVARARIGAEAV